jgi:hypothetical protein
MSNAIENARIAALEQTLTDCLSYLKRLPVNPTTFQRIRDIENILSDTAPAQPYVGAARIPTGLAIAGAVISNGRATVYSQAPAGDGEKLLQMLRRGIKFELHQAGPHHPIPDIEM